MGHGKLAQELRDLVDEARLRRKERGQKRVPLA
jgi:SpoVK/Ycf46/Vps4 family AAA+-type ATPase